MSQELDNEITKLTGLWMYYVGLDHHKDRDCHFWVTKMWSYGDPPTYSAEHYGYIANRWVGPKRETYELAAIDLIRFIKGEIKKAVAYAKQDLDPDDFWNEPEDRVKTLEIFADYV